MKLSEAIREGCKQTLPGTIYALRYEEDGKHACAGGCALLAAGVSEEILLAAEGDDEPLRPLAAEKFGEGVLADRVKVEYHGMTRSLSVFDAVIGLNDSERMTREQIADWLEGQGY